MADLDYPFYWSIFLPLLLIFIVSCIMFWIIALRDTLWRAKLRLHDWADDHGFALDNEYGLPLPEALAPLSNHLFTIDVALTGPNVMLLRLYCHPPPSARQEEGPMRWHVLLRHTGGDWRSAALRPAKVMYCLRDYFPMEDYPSVLSPERFLACAADRRAAATLAGSAAVRLLPSDIGLILIGPALILDFSARAFDPIEFDRMLAIAEQLTRQLPATATQR